MAWIEQGTCSQRPGETLVGIEQEGFGMVCAVLDYEGESVHRILRAVNAYDELLAACKELLREYRLHRPQIFGTDATEEYARTAIARAESIDGISAA